MTPLHAKWNIKGTVDINTSDSFTCQVDYERNCRRKHK